MANKQFPIFLHAGRGKRKGEILGMIRNSYKYLCFFCRFLQASVARSAEQETSNQEIIGTKPGVVYNFF